MFSDSFGHHISCTSGSASLHAVGDLATATTTTNPVVWTGCSNDLIGGSTTFTTAGTWSFTATSTTSVDAQAVNAAGPVLIIHVAGICDVSVPSPLNSPNNAWNNATHQLTINSATAFTFNQSAGCFGMFGITGTLAATFTFPGTVATT